jgi:hypothetical protein
VSEEVQGDAAAQRDGWDGFEWVPDVGQGLLDAQGDEDYPATIGRCR